MTDNNLNTITTEDPQFKADTLMPTSPILGQVIRLRDKISRDSDGTIVDYDDMVHRLQEEVQSLPILELQQNVASGTEGVYQRQLLHALEKINDDHDRVLRKLLKMKSRLMNAVNLMKIQRSQFTAFYSLAINAYIASLPNPKSLKLTAKGIEQMAAGEYSRLMDSLDLAALSLISELEILEVEIKTSKASQAAKYALGKDQVNAMWTSFQSNGAIGLDDDPEALLKKFPVEDEDEIPSFVSRHTKEVRVTSSGSFISPPLGICSKCGEKQFSTPSGATCINGHGGAPSAIEIKGTFVKHGDPKPITPIVDDDGEFLTISKTSDSIIGADKDVLDPPADISDKDIEEFKEKIDACKDYLFNTPIGERLIDQTKTKRLDIEDIDDYPPHSIPEAVKVMEESNVTLIDNPNKVEFKLIPGKKLTLPESAKPVEDIESILNDSEPLATVAPSTPRKKLMLLDEDDL